MILFIHILLRCRLTYYIIISKMVNYTIKIYFYSISKLIFKIHYIQKKLIKIKI